MCADSGLLATEACAADVRGSRVKSVMVASGTAPTESCGLHVTINYCNDGQCLAGEFCPAESVSSKSVLDYSRADIANVSHTTPADYIYTLEGIGVSGTEGETAGCSVHTAAPVVPEIDDPVADPDVPEGGDTADEWWNTLTGDNSAA